MIKFDWNPSARTLRQFALAATILLAALALSAHARGRSELSVGLLAALATATAAAGVVRPRALRLPFVLLTLAAFPIGAVLSQVALVVLFFGVITPLGLVARAIRPDWMRPDRRAEGYWQARRRPRDPASYLRQA